MESLTEKITKSLEDRANTQFNEKVRHELYKAIEEIKEIEDDADFKEVAMVMMKYLSKYHPHHKVLITNTTAELFESVNSVKYLDYITD